MNSNDRPQINIRVKAEELARYHEAAKAEGMSMAVWLRWVANRAAKRVVQSEKRAA